MDMNSGRIAIGFSMLMLAACGSNQGPLIKSSGKKPSEEKIRAIGKNTETAEFLYKYDRATRLGMQFMLEKFPGVQDSLSLEWFCIPGDKAWQIVFGKYRPKTGRYEIFLQLKMDKDFRISESDTEIGNGELVKYARCILNREDAIYTWRDKSHLDMFWYVRKNPRSKKLELWLLPPFDSKQGFCYGGDILYTFDKSGKNLLDSAINIDSFKCRKSNTRQKVVLDDKRNKYASVNTIFFALYVNSMDNTVTIKNKRGVNTMDSYLGEVKSWAMSESE